MSKISYGSIQRGESTSLMNMQNNQFGASSVADCLKERSSISANITKIKDEYQKLKKLITAIGGKDDTHILRQRM